MISCLYGGILDTTPVQGFIHTRTLCCLLENSIRPTVHAFCILTFITYDDQDKYCKSLLMWFLFNIGSYNVVKEIADNN